MRTQSDTSRSVVESLLAVGVIGAAAGSGRTSVAALLAAGLADQLEPAGAPVLLLDVRPAGGSPWPNWLKVPVQPSVSAAQPHRAVDALDLLEYVPWPLDDAAPGGPGVVVATDTGAQLPPGWVDAVLLDVAGGSRSTRTTGATALVVDGPCGLGTAAFWAARRGTPLPAIVSALLGDATRPGSVAVLVVRRDFDGIGSALDLVTDLERLSLPVHRLVVACVAQAHGTSRTAKARQEKLRGRVAAVVEIPYSPAVAAAGVPAYARQAKLRTAARTLTAAVLSVTGGSSPTGAEPARPLTGQPVPAVTVDILPARRHTAPAPVTAGAPATDGWSAAPPLATSVIDQVPTAQLPAPQHAPPLYPHHPAPHHAPLLQQTPTGVTTHQHQENPS